MTHAQQFYNYLKIINNSGLRYVIIRGFEKLPVRPDTDIDLVVHYEDFDKFLSLVSEYLLLFHREDRGRGEYCQMYYQPTCTQGDYDTSLPNGHFRIDTYNSFHFWSPLNNWNTYWTVEYKFNEKIFNDSRFNEEFRLPAPADELTLLALRCVLDRNRGGNNIKGWEKYLNRIDFLISRVTQEKLTNSFMAAKIASPMSASEFLMQKQFDLFTDCLCGRI